ncbi:MAG: hypothetical protein RL009_782, partial [Actinomycetota bacterium]
MIDLALLRENPEAIKASQRARLADESLVDQAISADAIWRKALLEFENLRAEQNAHGKLVAAAPKDEKAALVAAAQELSARVKAADAAASEAQSALDTVLWKIENVVVDGVPTGGEDDY